MRTRQIEFDIARGIGVAAVVFAHNGGVLPGASYITPYLIGGVVAIFAASTIIELIRMEVTKRHFILECDRIRKICMKFDDWWEVN